MVTRQLFFKIAMLVGCGMAFAANGTYNVFQLFQPKVWFGYDTVTYISQDDYSCKQKEWTLQSPANADDVLKGVGPKGEIKIKAQYSDAVPEYDSGVCLGSFDVTAEGFQDMMELAKAKTRGSISMATDLDLGEISSDTEGCVANHIPVKYNIRGEFIGNGHTVKNLCYEVSKMSGPVGFFESIDSTTVSKLKIDGVRIVIKDDSEDGKDYFPVGALAGYTNHSSVNNVSVANVSISAPFAGGLVGLLMNSSMMNDTAVNEISVTNSRPIITGFAGSETVVRNLGNGVLQKLSVFAPMDANNHKDLYNAYLGGLVGVAIRTNDDATLVAGKVPTLLQKSKVVAKVQDLAKGHRSALGGAIGMVNAGAGSKKDGNDQDISVVADRIIDVAVGESSSGGDVSVSGGSAMGGLIGFLSGFYSNGSPNVAPGSISIIKNEVHASIGNSASLDVIALGGLVGRNHYVDFTTVSYDNNTVSVKILDDVKDAGDFTYYAGGVIGFGNNCASSSRSASDFVSITNTVVSGSITVSSSGADKGLRMNAFLGGFAGTACLAADGNGLKNNTSAVTITSNIKTSWSTEKVSNGKPFFDTLAVGGFVGAMNSAQNVSLSDLHYTGKINVNDSLMTVMVGGLVGFFPERSGGKTIGFDNVLIGSGYTTSWMNYSSVLASKPTTESAKNVLLGGLCGYCNNIDSIQRAGVRGRITAKDGFAGDSLKVGGLVAQTYTLQPMVLQSSNMNGKIAVPDMATNVAVGYLLGDATIMNNEYKMVSNYHFGDDAAEPFGILFRGGSLVPDWKTETQISYLVRSSSVQSYDENVNGTEVDDNMKTEKFASFMNTPFGKDKSVWISDEGDENGLPFTVVPGQGADPAGSGKTFKVGFYLDKECTELIGKIIWADSGSAVVPPTDFAVEGKTFTGWSDSTYKNVTDSLKIYAKFDINKYEVTFLDYQDEKDTVIVYEYGTVVSYVPVRKETNAYTYTFTGWILSEDPEKSLDTVKAAVTVKPVYSETKKLYAVTFIDDITKEKIGDVVKVGYGEKAEPTVKIPTHEGYEFDSLYRVGSEVTGDTTVYAIYKKIVLSSSSSEEDSSSSSEPESSSSESPMKLLPGNIRSEGGDAVKFVVKAEGLDPAEETTVSLHWSSDRGNSGDVTLECGKVGALDTTYELVPAPAGNYSWTMIVTNGNDVKESEDVTFEVNPKIVTKPQSWNMVYLPAVKDLDCSKTSGIYWWDESTPVGEYWQYQNFRCGMETSDEIRGFWVGSANGKTLEFKESSGDANSKIVWKLEHKYSGWNLMANPYGWAVKVPEFGDSIVVWDRKTGEYDHPTYLAPYEAVWVKSPKDTVVEFLATPYYDDEIAAANEAQKKPKPSKTLRKVSSASWSLSMALMDSNGKRDSRNMIGAGSNVESMEEPPAAMGDHVSLSIRENGARLAKSVKVSADEYEWELDASAYTLRRGEIAFDGLEELEMAGMHLYATVDGETTQIAPGETLPLILTPSGKKVNVRVASAPKAKVAASKIGDLHMALAAGSLQMQFNVSAELAGAASHYALVGVDGKKIASGHFTATAGTNSLNVAAPKSGVYFMQVKVGSQMKASKIMVK